MDEFYIASSKDIAKLTASDKVDDQEISSLKTEIVNLNSMITAVSERLNGAFLSDSGPIDANNSLMVDLGDYTFEIKKNANNWFASGWITRKDGVPTPCLMSWKSAWGTTSQWYTYNWTQDSTPVATDTDLGYGATPSRGGSHIVVFMDCVTYKLWNITCMIGGNIDSSADFGCIIVDATGAR